MKKWYPDIITTTLCLFCNEQSESLNHLVTCSKLDNEWKDIILNALNNTKKSIKRALDIDALIEHIKRTLIEDRTDEWMNSRYLEGLLRGFLAPGIMQL